MNEHNDFQNIPGLQLLIEELSQILQRATNAAIGMLEACSSIDGFISNHPTFFTSEGSKDIFRNYILSEASKKLSENSSANTAPQPYVQHMMGNNVGTVGGYQQPTNSYTAHTFGMYNSSNIVGPYPNHPIGMYCGPLSHPQNQHTNQNTNLQFGPPGNTNVTNHFIAHGAATMSPAGAYNFPAHVHYNLPHGNNWQQPPMAPIINTNQQHNNLHQHNVGATQQPVPNAFTNPPTMNPNLTTHHVNQQNAGLGVNVMAPPDAIVIPSPPNQPNVPNQQFGNNPFATIPPGNNIQPPNINTNAAMVIAGNQQGLQIPAQDVYHLQPSIIADSVSLSTHHTSAKHATTGIRYDTVKGMVFEARSFEDAAILFESTYGCQITKKPVQLQKDGKMQRNRQNNTTTQKYNCSCGVDNVMVSSKLRISDSNEHVPIRNFFIQYPKTHLSFVDKHLFKLVDSTSLPNVVKNKVVSILQEDPTASVWEVLHEILVCNDSGLDDTQMSIPQWIINELFGNGNNVFPLLINLISQQSIVAIQNMERALANENTQDYQIFHGCSVQSVIHYSQRYSFTRYIRAGLVHPVFQNFQQFVDFYNFGKPDQIITIPVIQEMFDGTTFSQEKIDKANACLLFTSPAHIWAIHQLLSSETHKELNVFSMDGTFPLRMARSGSDKTVIISLGFINLDVHNNKANSNITRAFVPIVHCLSQSESSPAAFICLRGLSSLYQSMFGTQMSIDLLCADNSSAISSGLAQAYPNANIITDIEHVRSGPTNKWNDKIRGGNKMQKLLIYWIHLLFQTRSHVNYINAFGILLEQLRAMGETALSDFLENRFGPNGTYPWNMRFNSSNRVGIIAEQQQIESYYGMIKPKTKLGRCGALNTNAGFSYLLRHGFSSLLSWDVRRTNRFSVGFNSHRMIDAIKDITPEHMILALTMHETVDQLSTISPNETVNQYCVVPGYLCNGPTHIGKKITTQHLMDYVSANMQIRPPNSWPHGFKKYINITNRFCLVRSIREYANSSEERRKEVKHLMFLPEGTYFCNCALYWERLNCPASTFINDWKHKLHVSLANRIQLIYSGQDVTLATPNRRRGLRAPPQGQMSLMFESLGLPYNHDSNILKFMFACRKITLDKAARLRSKPSKILRTKSDSIMHIIAGTTLGNDVLRASRLTRQDMYSSWVRMQNNTFVSDSTFLDQNNQFNAIFNPFPEGRDETDPNCCVSYWLSIPHVDNLMLNNVNLISFFYACQHVSTPGFGGRVSEYLLTSLERITNFSIFRQGLNVGHNLMLSVFMNQFHQRYLIQATVTNYHVDDNRINSPNDNRAILKTHVQAVVQLMSLDENTGTNPRMSCAMVVGSLSLSILRLSVLQEMDVANVGVRDYTYHVIIPSRRTYFIGPMRQSGSTNTILYSTEALTRFLERVVDCTNLSGNVVTNNLFEAWIYKESIIDPGQDSTVNEDEEESYHGLSVQDIAEDNIQLLLQEDNEDEDNNNNDNAQEENNTEQEPRMDGIPINTIQIQVPRAMSTIPATDNRHGANISRLSNLHEEIVLHNLADTNPNNNEELSYANQNHTNSRTRRNTRRSNNAGREPTNNDGAPQEPVTQRRRGRPRQNTRRDQTQQQPNESQTETGNTRRTRANNSLHMDGEDIPTNPEPVQRTRRRNARKRKADEARQPSSNENHNEINPFTSPTERNLHQETAMNIGNLSENDDDEHFFDENHTEEYLGQSEIEEDTVPPGGNESPIPEDDVATILASQESSHVSNTMHSIQEPDNNHEQVREQADNDNTSLSDIRRQVRNSGRDICISMGFYNVIHYPEDETYEVSGLENADEEKMQEMNLVYDRCVLCQGNMAAIDGSEYPSVKARQNNDEELDSDETGTEEPDKCFHEYHLNCFLRNLQKTYIESKMNSNRPHLLKPAVRCCLCSRFVLWENKKTKELIPEGFPIYGIHIFRDVWNNDKLVCENWITCPYLYAGLKQTLDVEIDKTIVLPKVYQVLDSSSSTKKMINNKVFGYLNKVMPKQKCAECAVQCRLHDLFGHMPYSSLLPPCNHRFCEECLLTKLRNLDDRQEKSNCRLHCPKCNEKVTYYSLLGHKAKDYFKKKRIRI
jgi:hypothetical protein